MKQPDKRTPFLFITLGIVAILLLLIDMATGDTYIPITKVWAVLTGGECDEMTRNILLSIRFIRVVVAALIGIALSVSGLQMQIVFHYSLNTFSEIQFYKLSLYISYLQIFSFGLHTHKISRV